MNEEQLYAALGRKQVALDALNVQYDLLLEQLLKVASGEISRGRVSVSLENRSWSIAPDKTEEAPPA